MMAALCHIGLLLPVAAFVIFARARTPRHYLIGWSLQFVAQPFWLASTWVSAQWSMFAVSVFFLIIATHGVLRFWGECRAEQERIVP